MSFYQSVCQSFYPRSWKAWLYVYQNHQQNHHGSKRTTSLQLTLQEPQAQRGAVYRWDAFPWLGRSLTSSLVSPQLHHLLDFWSSCMNWRVKSAAPRFRLMSTETCTIVGPRLRLSDLCPCLHVHTPAFSPPGLSGDCKDSQGLCVPTQKSYSSSETLKAFDQHQDQTRLELGIWLWGVFHLEWPGFNFLTRRRPNLPPKTRRTRNRDEQVRQAG